MALKDFFSSRQGRFLWVNLLAMFLVLAGLVFGVLKGLDVYTRHGEAVVVPDVKGMGVQEAEKMFRNRGLLCEVSDSSYVKTLPAGSILEHNPAAGQKVKEGRIVYLTINTMNIPLQEVPDVADNSSLRQAEARILASGFKLDSVEYIPGEKDWVYGVKYRGRELTTGEKVPTGAMLMLVAGNGGELPTDSLAVDSLGNPVEPVVPADDSAADESWF